MNAAEIKLDLFRKIDSLNEAELELVYEKILALMSATSRYNLSEDENKAIDASLKVSEEGAGYTHDEVVEEASRKYPNLKFKRGALFGIALPSPTTSKILTSC